MADDIRTSLEQIAKIAKTMDEDKDLSVKNRCQVDRILGIADKLLTAMGEAEKSGEGG